MMVFLFSSMVLLIAFSVSNGLLIILNKAKFDFQDYGFWGRVRLNYLGWEKIYYFMVFFYLSGWSTVWSVCCPCYSGIFGRNYPINFVETSIPVKITLTSVLISFGIPYVFSVTYALYALKQFGQERIFCAQSNQLIKNFNDESNSFGRRYCGLLFC